MKYGKVNLGQIEVLLNKLGGEEVIDRILRGEATVTVNALNQSSLLERLCTVKVKGADEFVAKKHFREGKTTKGVRIPWLGDNFKRQFLGKIEKNVSDVELAVHRLREASFDPAIITELGGEAQVEVSLAHLFQLLEAHVRGEQVPLLLNGYANIFYIRDMSGVLWAVHASLRDDGWNVEAYSLDNPYRWYVGYQVFSR